MATTHGSVGEFDNTEEDWETYVERVDLYFTANGITDAAKKRAILLSVCGAKTYRTIGDLVAPLKPKEVSYDDIVSQVQKHFNPKPVVTVQRFKFNSRSRRADESVATFVAALRHLAIHCAYGDSLNDMLRDRLICGINDARIQRRLLAEAEIDFPKALQIAQAMESADRDAQDLQTLQSETPGMTEAAVHSAGGGVTNRQGGVNYPNCYRCGRRHRASVCRHKETVCNICGKKGHIARACRSKDKDPQPKSSEQNQPQPSEQDQPKPMEQSQPQGNTNTVTQEAVQADDDIYEMFPLRGKRYDPIYATVTMNSTPVQMEIDTGATLSVISEDTFNQVWKDQAPPLRTERVKLRTYTGQEIPVKGALDVEVEHGGQCKKLVLVVTEGQGPSLLGRNWLGELKIDWKNTYKVQESNTLTAVLDAHEAVFRKELGTINCTTAKIQVDPQVPPVFHKPRPVPFSLRHEVEVELERLEKEGIIRPRQFSQWAAPIVAVPKSDGSVRICGDYKVTANKAMICDTHPIPRIEDILAAMSGGVSFTKLDLSHAYLQLQLDESARDYLVINTHKGLFEYTRMPFGITSAPGVFQRTMDNLLQGLQHVTVYIDDILITGTTEEQHLETLNEVLTRLETAGMRLKKEKCVFMASEVVYLGHCISKDGLQPTEEKVKAVTETPQPTNVSELRAFLGLVNYYGKFMQNLSTLLAPLYALLRKKVPWEWREEQQEAFEKTKALLKSPKLLAHYDSNKELILTCDASPYGLGAVLAHKMKDGSERPIAYASRTLTAAERNYAQIDKEALAIIYGVKRYHQYLYGRKFMIHSDHKPLMYLFGEHRGVPTTASARVQRWALTLSGYQYSIVYQPGDKIGNADGLSRLPLPTATKDTPVPYDMILLMERLNASLVTAAQIRTWTEKDPTLAKVRKSVLQGWPDGDMDEQMSPYARRREELSVEDGCILWGTRVIVPPQLRSKVVDEIHEGHPGIARMKSFARSYVWWPGLDVDLENKVKQCLMCQRVRKMPPKRPIQTWEWPEKPWTRIHLDHAGPIQGKTVLIIVDAHSKWIDAHIVPSTSSAATISKLRSTFATHGLPEVIVSDNGPAFTSSEFQQFVKANGMRHMTSAPYHPASNGLAERAVQTLKEGVKKMSGPLEVRIARFLFKYRVTPQATTGRAPAELLMGRRLRTHLDLLYPTVQERVRRRQMAQKISSDSHARIRQFRPGDRVMCRNFAMGPSWLPGIVSECEGNTMVKVKLDDGRMWRRHVDHIIQSGVVTETDLNSSRQTTSISMEMDPLTTPADVEPGAEPDRTSGSVPVSEGQPSPVDGGSDVRRSTRDRRPPDRLMTVSELRGEEL